MGQGRRAIRLALIDERAPSALKAEEAIDAILREMPGASQGTLGLEREDIGAVLQKTAVEELPALLEAAWPGSRVTSAIGELEWAKHMKKRNSAVDVFSLTAGRMNAVLMDAAVAVTVAKDHRLPPVLAKQLQQIGDISMPRGDLTSTDVEAPVSEYEQRMRSKYPAATKN